MSLPNLVIVFSPTLQLSAPILHAFYNNAWNLFGEVQLARYDAWRLGSKLACLTVTCLDLFKTCICIITYKGVPLSAVFKTLRWFLLLVIFLIWFPSQAGSWKSERLFCDLSQQVEKWKVVLSTITRKLEIMYNVACRAAGSSAADNNELKQDDKEMKRSWSSFGV